MVSRDSGRLYVMPKYSNMYIVVLNIGGNQLGDILFFFLGGGGVTCLILE